MKNILMSTTLTLLIGGAASAGGAGPAPIVTPVKPVTIALPKPMMAMVPCTQGSWAKEAIALVTAKGLFIGYPDGGFDWCNPITRQEVAQVLARLLAQLPENQTTFDPAELDTLRRGVQEALDGLKELTARVDAQDVTIADLQSQIAALQQAMDNMPTVGGDAGMAGVDGAVGPQGEKGEMGAAGAQGETGPQGPAGANGADGAAGVAGANGADGAQGVQGVQGETGAVGPQGAAGLDFVPPEAPFRYGNYIGASYYSILQDNVGSMARVMVGNDALFGNFGVRLTGDIQIKAFTPGNSVSGLFTYRGTTGRFDGILGVGGGYNLERPSTNTSATFGELLIGVDYRVIDRVAVFGEARQHYYFDGSNDNISSIAAGLKFRF